MKKLNYLLLGAAGLLMASCSQEDLAGPANGDGNVQITVNLPGDALTRAEFGSGTSSKVLNYAVYEVTNGNAQFSFDGTADFGNSLSTTLSLNLLNKEYKIAFFAQSDTSEEEGVYTFTAKEGVNPTISVNYDNMTSAGNLADAYDCFYNFVTVDFSSNASTPSPATQTVYLYRPVAQVNWGANDIGATEEISSTFGDNGQYIMTSLDVTGLPTSLDLFTGELSEDNLYNGVIGQPGKEFQIPASSQVYPVNYPTNKYVAIQYILAGVPQEISGTTATSNIYEFTLNIDNSGETEEGESADMEYATDVVAVNVPIQANYQTNIYGSLLSTNASFDIEVVPGFAGNIDVDVNAAEVKIENGKVTCITPKLPAGVTVKSLEDNEAGGVALDKDGNPVYFAPTAKGIQEAINAGATEIYFAPNARINNSNRFNVPESGLTIHGNGATLYGSNYEISINNSYTPGSTFNLDISNLNNGKVWGAPSGQFTVNLTMTNCTMTAGGITDGALSLTNLSNDNPEATINMTFDNCYVQEAQLGVYSNYPGTIVGKDCVFTNVGIPYNYNNKSTTIHADVTITGNTFNTCGILQSSSNSASQYAAPIRVVCGKAKDMITLLVDNCTFKDTQSPYDILLMDYRPDYAEKWFPFSYTIQNCTPDNPTVKAN